MKTCELEEAQLDYWVVRSLVIGFSGRLVDDDLIDDIVEALGPEASLPFRPSTIWAHGGPIIERERIDLRGSYEAWWTATTWSRPEDQREDSCATADLRGPTPLIAAMRAYVASKFGEEVPEA